MNASEAYSVMAKGKSIRHKTWGGGQLLRMSDEGQIIDDEGEVNHSLFDYLEGWVESLDLNNSKDLEELERLDQLF